MTREIVSSSKQDWGTPQKLFDVLHAEHQYTVDLMAAWYNAKLPSFIGPGSSLSEDIFSIPWGGIRGFCNPPYEIVEKCLSYAIDQVALGAFTTWLLPANPDTKWFHEFAILGQIDFFKGRISFEDTTPADVEALRYLALYEHKKQKKLSVQTNLLKKWAGVLYELTEEEMAKSDKLRYAVSVIEKETDQWRIWGENEKDRKKPGPGFPSMLVHFDPTVDLLEPKPLRRRSAKTGKLL